MPKRSRSGDVSKPARAVGPGDILTFVQATQTKVVRILACGDRRGPAPEAQALYTDLSPPEPGLKKETPENPAFEGKGRPSKRDRRILDLSKARHLE